MYKFIIVLLATISLAIFSDLSESGDFHALSHIANIILTIVALVCLFSQNVAQSKTMRLLVLVLSFFSGIIIFAIFNFFPELLLFRLPMKVRSFFNLQESFKLIFLWLTLSLINLLLWATIKLIWRQLRWSTLIYACLAATFLSVPLGIIVCLP